MKEKEPVVLTGAKKSNLDSEHGAGGLRRAT